MKTIAEGVDRALLGRVHAYLGSPSSRVGKLGGLSSSNAKDYVLDAREKLNIDKAPVDGRKLVMAPTSETAMLKTDLFLKANERGDGGNALQNATLGRILGFDTYMAQNVNCVLSGSVTDSDPVTRAVCGGRRTGHIESVLAPAAGEFVNMAGNDQPTWATGTDAAWFTLNEALKYATEDNAVATRYGQGRDGCCLCGRLQRGHRPDRYRGGRPRRSASCSPSARPLGTPAHLYGDRVRGDAAARPAPSTWTGRSRPPWATVPTRSPALTAR